MSYPEDISAGEIVPELRDINKVLLTVGDTDFLIPAPYLNRLKVKFKPGFMGAVKAFGLFALLPDMEHITPENRAQFNVWGHGKRIEIGVRRRSYTVLEKIANFARFTNQNIDYEKYEVTGLHELPVANFQKGKRVRYIDKTDDLGLALITCDLKNSGPSPGCQLDYEFLEGIEIDARFSASYLSGRYEVMTRIRTLLSDFVTDAEIYKASSKPK